MTFWLILIWILGAFITFEFEEFDFRLESFAIAFAWPIALPILAVAMLLGGED
jgi:hypothetical protein